MEDTSILFKIEIKSLHELFCLIFCNIIALYLYISRKYLLEEENKEYLNRRSFQMKIIYRIKEVR